MNIFKNFFLILLIGSSPLAYSQNDEPIELLLEKINLLKKEIQELTASVETNNLALSRLDEANQIRYVDLDKRIHLLETKLLFEESQIFNLTRNVINLMSAKATPPTLANFKSRLMQIVKKPKEN